MTVQKHSMVKQNLNVFEKVYVSSLKLLYPYTPEKTYETIVKEAMNLVGAKYGSLFLNKQDDLQRVYTTNKKINTILPRKRGNTWKAFNEQRPYLLESYKVNKSHPELEHFNIGSDLGFPLTFNDKSFGVLSLLSGPENRFSKDDLHILQLFSPLASLALRNTHLYSDVKQSLQEQDMFISMAAHELKTPLTAISIYAQLVLKETSEKKFISIHVKEKMFHEVQRLSKLVNELLQVSQIKKGRLQYSMRKCDIVKVAEQTTASFQTIDQKHKIRFRVDSPNRSCPIKGDSDKMTQVISNLLTNAAKFSPEGKPIDVILKKQKDVICIIVRDHGIGMTHEQKSHIFEDFYKAAIKKKEGLGLGLFLVKNIIDYHKGTITVTSKPNHGTTFIITLPLYA